MDRIRTVLHPEIPSDIYSEEMSKMVDKMLEKQPENRVTAEELIAWVEQLLPNEDKSRIKLDLSPNPQ